MTASTDPLAGSRFRTLRQLGQGGMGVVVEAERIGLGRRYAVKLLLAEGLTEPSAIERFRREAQVLARLSSAHLVGVHDLDVTSEGRPYIVMDLLHGRNLREVLRERAGEGLPVGDALRFAREALAGLAVAHAEGVVHRDVKLDNLFLTEPDGGGTPLIKVLDFGIAKAVASLREGDADALQTGTGVIVGTPKYASPEQIKGDPVDARADLYAVALVLFELLTGQYPFDREVENERGPMRMNALYRANLLSKPPAPSTLLASPLPEGLDAIVLRGLEKDPRDRWPSARAFAEALAKIEGATFRAPKTSSMDSAARRESVFDAGDLFLGKYRIEKLLGRGGMGEVYLAHHEVLSERYALKVLPLVRAKVAQRRNMLLREAKAATKVKHESIVRVVDAGVSEDDLVYLLMEYLDGWAPLTSHLGKMMPLVQTLAIAARTAAGLEACHGLSILHRDLKPDNVMVSGAFEVRLIDFGLAYFRDDKERITLQGQSGPRFGTVLYMAPEQIVGGDATMASDMFALGLILFEMLVGKHLTEAVLGARATTSQRVQLAYTLAPVLPRVSSVRHDVPRALDDLVAGLLDLDVARRPTAPDVRLQLQRLGKELRGAASASSSAESTAPLPLAQNGAPLRGLSGAPSVGSPAPPAGSYAPTEPVPELAVEAPMAGPRGTVKMDAFRDPLFDAPGSAARSPAPLPAVPPPSFGPPPAIAPAMTSPSPPAAHAEPLMPFGRPAMGSSPYLPVVAPANAQQRKQPVQAPAPDAKAPARQGTPRSPVMIIGGAAALGLLVVLAAWLLVSHAAPSPAGAAPGSSRGAAP